MTAARHNTSRAESDAPAPARPPLNALAVWSLVFSAATLFGLGSLIGVALGVVALNQIAVHRQRGRVFAFGGIALGTVTLFVSMIVFVRYFVES